MLKIRDDIDLKELEKYGFKYTDVKDWYKYNLNMDISIGDNKELNIECDDCYFNEDINECIEWLYDLIKDGLVEKVGDEINNES